MRKKLRTETIIGRKINKNNISLLGFSQGTILGMATALNHPSKIKNVIGLSGYINHDILPNNTNDLDYSNLNFYL